MSTTVEQAFNGLVDALEEELFNRIQMKIAESQADEQDSTPEPEEQVTGSQQKPRVKLHGEFVPLKNWNVTAKRFLAVADPSDTGDVLKEILKEGSVLGQAYFERAIKAYPSKQRSEARDKLMQAFKKLEKSETPAAS